MYGVKVDYLRIDRIATEIDFGKCYCIEMNEPNRTPSKHNNGTAKRTKQTEMVIFSVSVFDHKFKLENKMVWIT